MACIEPTCSARRRLLDCCGTPALGGLPLPPLALRRRTLKLGVWRGALRRAAESPQSESLRRPSALVMFEQVPDALARHMPSEDGRDTRLIENENDLLIRRAFPVDAATPTGFFVNLCDTCTMNPIFQYVQ
jgi:hypothetical protein